MRKSKVVALSAIMLATIGIGVGTLTSCGGNFDGVMIWGPIEHEQLYLEAVEKFKESHPEFKAEVKFGPQGDAGAYANVSVDPQSAGSIVTFPNDQLANLKRIGALSKLSNENTKWIKENHSVASCESGKIGDSYYAYPLSADNGFVFVYNKDAFVGTSVWDEQKDGLKDGYTFRDLHKALDEKEKQNEKWKDALCIWPSGSAWYESGVFFATGGDYSVTYDEKGEQKSADCWFGYKEENGVKNFDSGLEAINCMLNTFTTEDGKVSKHFIYSDDTNPAYNDIVSIHTQADSPTPLAGIITWNNPILKEKWGENYRADVLPTLVSDSVQLGGQKKEYTWKSFSGFKLLGVNPYSEFARKSPENLTMLHELAKYLADVDASIARYEASGMGPSNNVAQENEQIKNDTWLTALNKQYNLNEGTGFRVQDSTPSNFWTPIGNFGLSLFKSVAEGEKGYFDTVLNAKRTLTSLQADIVSAAK